MPVSDIRLLGSPVLQAAHVSGANHQSIRLAGPAAWYYVISASAGNVPTVAFVDGSHMSTAMFGNSLPTCTRTHPAGAAGAVITSSGRVTAYDRTVETIRSFATLPAGWHYGDGVPPTAPMIETAVGWIGALHGMGLAVTDAFPGVDGSMMVTAYHDRHYIELLLHTDSSVSLTYERGDEEWAFDNITAGEAYEKLRGIAGEIWNTYAWSIPSTSIASGTNSKAWLSGTRDRARQSSAVRALRRREPAFVNMSDDITPTWEVNRPYSGSSMIRLSRPERA